MELGRGQDWSGAGACARPFSGSLADRPQGLLVVVRLAGLRQPVALKKEPEQRYPAAY
ncbi:hypothetical protein [Paenibacillus ihbetae]|uniref:hypothetical protein n=1 Tax=Paenibacillus ihbetae TaxID=1870820 RepID=UPI0016725DD1|nr:hypothetical protein [Paenibacillus ihbetae]